jgi:hypothetical protein
MMLMRQRLILAAAGMFFGDFIPLEIVAMRAKSETPAA